MKIQTTDISKIYLGSAEVSKAYLGTTLVYEAGGGALPDYLCFTANQANSTVGIVNNGSNNPNVEYSTDGATWSTLANNTPITLSNVGDKMYVRGNNANGWGTSSSNYTKFTMTGQIAASGNIMSLISTTDFESLTTIPSSNYCFNNLFANSTSLVSAEHLTLPATTLAPYCYDHMFYGCTSLTTAPELPATTLANYCYDSMFRNCTRLTNAPTLPATSLAQYCYSNMFNGCTSLVAVPSNMLPATGLASNCYLSMFKACSGLTTAPSLPSTTLAQSCYSQMFQDCTSLTAAPSLPATTLADRCYNAMFENTNVLPDCTNIDFTSSSVVASAGLRGLFRGTKVTDNDLNIILPHDANNHYCLPVTTLANYCYYDMFYGCTLLTTAPTLPATTLADYCYAQMFRGCTSLTTAPTLPATSLAQYCYYYMFSYCTSLTTAPVLSATALTQYCYGGMFANCNGLTTAPELPATGLVNNCYREMFKQCTNLTYIKALFLDVPSINYTRNWVSGIETLSGRFVMNSAATWSPDDYRGQAYGIPQNWVVEDENGYELSRPDEVD